MKLFRRKSPLQKFMSRFTYQSILAYWRTWIKKGFTLIEILVVVAILAILSTTVIVSVMGGRTKAEDVSMKSDLSRLKIAFEDYYNDHNCYPSPEWIDPDVTPVSELKPYLDKLIFNKKTDGPYVLEKDQTGCKWFKLYTTLNNPDDPEAVLLRTTDPSVGSTLGNYGVSSANTVVSIFYVPTTSPTPGPTNKYYCSGTGQGGGCTSFDPTKYNCSPSYSDPSCTGSNGCATAGSCTPL